MYRFLNLGVAKGHVTEAGWFPFYSCCKALNFTGQSLIKV